MTLRSERPVIVIPASAFPSATADPLFSCVLVPVDPNVPSFLADAFPLVRMGSRIEFCAVVDEGRLMRECHRAMAS